MKQHALLENTIAIAGFGVEGQSVARFALLHGATVHAYDEKKSAEDVAGVTKTFDRDRFVFHYGPFPDFSATDTTVVSPGIRLDRPEILSAVKAGKRVTTATNLFMDNTPCPVIGVTGTKGKGTTASLIYEMLAAAGRDAYLGGNIGTPPLEFLDRLTPESIAVLELSSFQIAPMTKSPHIAVILMVTSEHLDYHRDTDEYVSAKANLLAHQTHEDWVVVNIDYANSRKIAGTAHAKVIPVSAGEQVQEGAFVSHGRVWWRYDGQQDIVIETKDIYIPGKHNWENAVAAVAAAKLAGVATPPVSKTLREFKGLPHRLEFVCEAGGVKYFDDSFSTTPETAIAAMAAFSQPKVVILGGSSKNSDFSELGRVINGSDSIRAIIGIGVEWPVIKSEIRNPEIEIIEGCKNMKEIVKAAQDAARPGDRVVLTPACASFDMFRNYKDRGDQFKKEVLLLRDRSAG